MRVFEGGAHKHKILMTWAARERCERLDHRPKSHALPLTQPLARAQPCHRAAGHVLEWSRPHIPQRHGALLGTLPRCRGTVGIDGFGTEMGNTLLHHVLDIEARLAEEALSHSIIQTSQLSVHMWTWMCVMHFADCGAYALQLLHSRLRRSSGTA